MSGTSLDGADGVLVRLERLDEPEGSQLDWHILGRFSQHYPAGLRARLQASMHPAGSDISTITQLNQELGQFYADLAERVTATGARVDLVALSGQTVYHVPRVTPERGWFVKSTLQLGEAAVVLERLQVPIVSDFRQSDLAAGGEGAPLVPFADLKLFGIPGRA